MDWWLVMPMGLILGWITIQDFRERRISVVGLMVLFVLGIVHSGLALQWMGLTNRIVFNSLFAGFILVSGTLLVKIKKRGDPVSALIGSGDLLFLFAISPLFAFGSYLVFLNTSMILILFIYGIYLAFTGKSYNTIPLAGSMAMYLMVLGMVDYWMPVDLMGSSEWILKLFR